MHQLRCILYVIRSVTSDRIVGCVAAVALHTIRVLCMRTHIVCRLCVCCNSCVAYYTCPVCILCVSSYYICVLILYMCHHTICVSCYYICVLVRDRPAGFVHMSSLPPRVQSVHEATNGWVPDHLWYSPEPTEHLRNT